MLEIIPFLSSKTGNLDLGSQVSKSSVWFTTNKHSAYKNFHILACPAPRKVIFSFKPFWMNLQKNHCFIKFVTFFFFFTECINIHWYKLTSTIKKLK